MSKMNIHNSFVIIILSTILFSCGSNQDKKKKYFSISTENNQVVFKINETIKASIKNKDSIKIDSVTFVLNTKETKSKSGFVFQEKIDSEKLGKQVLKAHVFYNGNVDTITKKITLLNNVAPKIYTYKIVAEYPHDNKAYTQGLEFFGDTLYENTGKKGVSSLRKLDLATGKVLQKTDLDNAYFGEGITILDRKIYQLTWQSKTGFIYDLNTLKKTGSFAYNNSKEGWGLCNNGKVIYKSDGTEKIWLLDPNTLAEQDYIQVVTNKGVKTRFNELEWVDGKIYANTYQKDGIAIINSNTGALEGVINLKGLRSKATPTGKEDHSDYVLNGIAYKPDTQQLFVTGKYWDKLFEIEIIEK